MGRDSCTRLCFRLERGPSTRALASRKCTCRQARQLVHVWRLGVARHMRTSQLSPAATQLLDHTERVGAEHLCQLPATCLMKGGRLAVGI